MCDQGPFLNFSDGAWEQDYCCRMVVNQIHSSSDSGLALYPGCMGGEKSISMHTKANMLSYGYQLVLVNHHAMRCSFVWLTINKAT